MCRLPDRWGGLLLAWHPWPVLTPPPPAGTYRPDRNREQGCIAKTNRCGAGQRVSNPSSSTADYTCEPCPDGASGKSGKSPFVPCFLALHRLMGFPCWPGQYQSSTSHTAGSCVAKQATCPAGQYVTNPTSRSQDRLCAACSSGPSDASHPPAALWRLPMAHATDGWMLLQASFSRRTASLAAAASARRPPVGKGSMSTTTTAGPATTVAPPACPAARSPAAAT